jgi:hypothetical protein
LGVALVSDVFAGGTKRCRLLRASLQVTKKISDKTDEKSAGAAGERFARLF